ncbi:MAG: hypothetical protein ACRD0X_00820, partial [Thermoanaerobaculia bacterium]
MRDPTDSIHRLPLAALTVAAGVLRFIRLDRPCLWADEAMTYRRVAGSFATLAAELREDGFVPLHYVATWLLGRVVTLTPFWLRLAPAIAGTLMVPVMYFLARELAGRRAALLAAAMTASSAFLLFYSRDAKMYMPTWLCAVLQVALFLAWLGRGGAWRWAG